MQHTARTRRSRAEKHARAGPEEEEKEERRRGERQGWKRKERGKGCRAPVVAEMLIPDRDVQRAVVLADDVVKLAVWNQRLVLVVLEVDAIGRVVDAGQVARWPRSAIDGDVRRGPVSAP